MPAKPHPPYLRQQAGAALEIERHQLLNAFRIGVEEGLQRQNARFFLKAVRVGALDGDFEQDVRDAQKILSQTQNGSSLREVSVLASAKSLAGFDLIGIHSITH